jgi:hypothetical protein
MSALSVNDPEDPRSHRYYAPRQPRIFAREATLQPMLERLRGGARDYSADERLGNDADPLSSTQPEFVIIPERRFPLAALAAFAGGVTAVAALALGYVVLGTNVGSPAGAAAPVAPPSAQAPAKIVARVAPNDPVSHTRPVQPVQAQIATAGATAPEPADSSKGDRLDAAAHPTVGGAYNPLQSPLGLWSLSPTQAAIEGSDPTLAAPGAPSATAAAAAAAPPPAAPPHQVAHEHHAEHHVASVRHHIRHRVRQVHHHHHRKATTGAASTVAGQTGANGTAQPTAAKKLLGLFGG